MLKKVLLMISAMMICGWTLPSANAACDHIMPSTQPFPISGNNEFATFFGNLCWVSSSGIYFFDWQTDGNFVLYNSATGAIWASHTSGRGKVLAFQQDGNLVVYDANHRALWASNTAGDNNHNEALVVQNDGNAVIYESGRGKWDTRHHPAP